MTGGRSTGARSRRGPPTVRRGSSSSSARSPARRWPRGRTSSSVGVGVPGLYDPAAGTTRFLVNLPGDWDGLPVAAPMSAALGLPVALINDARAFGLAELRLGAGAAPRRWSA